MKFRKDKMLCCVMSAWLCPWIGCSKAPPVTTNVPPILSASVVPNPKLPPLLLHLPGIGGARSLDTSMVRGLQQGGFSGEIQIYDWTDHDPGLKALLLIARNKRQASLLAGKITDRFDTDPAARIILTCHSGGAGIAVWALEDLPDRVKIDTLLMLAPALSPKYDLTRALKHVMGRAYVFSSLDDPVLGLGTRMFGTIDGVKTDAAGEIGFIRPVQADPGQYEKLIPMPYDPKWVYFNNYGDHVGAMSRTFARFSLAPLVLRGTYPSTQPVDPIMVSP